MQPVVLALFQREDSDLVVDVPATRRQTNFQRRISSHRRSDLVVMTSDNLANDIMYSGESLSCSYLTPDKECRVHADAGVRLFEKETVAHGMAGGIDPVLVIIGTIVTLGLTLYQYLRDRNKESNQLKKVLPFTDQSQKLHEHSNEFKNKEIVTIEKNIHVAIGFGIANAILIEGE